MQMGANGDHVDGDTSRHRRVRFREDEALVAEFDDTNLWGHGKEKLLCVCGRVDMFACVCVCNDCDVGWLCDDEGTQDCCYA